jgi:hypothetical protein
MTMMKGARENETVLGTALHFNWRCRLKPYKATNKDIPVTGRGGL